MNGIASWNGKWWRPLLAACAPLCADGVTTAGGEQFSLYFTSPVFPIQAADLKASGDYLYARGMIPQLDVVYLMQWRYLDGDSGIWTIKSAQSVLTTSGQSFVDFRGDSILAGNGSSIMMAAQSGFLKDEQGIWGDALVYQIGAENRLDMPAWGSNIYVLRSSAGSLTGSSPLAFFLSLF